MDISPRQAELARSQMQDAPPAVLQKPVIPPPDPPIALPTVPPPGPGIVPASLKNQGTVRVSVRAWVNGRPIFDEEVMQLAGPELSRLHPSLPDAQRSDKMTDLMNTVIDQLVDQELMYQDAVKKLEKANPKALEKLREYVDKEFDKTLQRMRDAKVPEEQVRKLQPTAKRMMERNIISTEYARSRIMPSLGSLVGLPQIREYYETHLSEFRSVDRVVWQDIFIPVDPRLPTIEQAQRFGEELINSCRKSEDFEKLMAHNQGDSKLRGGMGLGQKRGEIRPIELEEALFKLKEGEIGPVIPFTTGVHLIRATKREYDGQLPLNDEVQKIIRKKLEGQLMEREYRRIVRELRQRAIVHVEREQS
jgi:parvulin-like peptidyl-prolyl isomerase